MDIVVPTPRRTDRGNKNGSTGPKSQPANAGSIANHSSRNRAIGQINPVSAGNMGNHGRAGIGIRTNESGKAVGDTPRLEADGGAIIASGLRVGVGEGRVGRSSRLGEGDDPEQDLRREVREVVHLSGMGGCLALSLLWLTLGLIKEQ